MARSGLKKVVKTVKGKKGNVRRTYWVKAQAPVKRVRAAGSSFMQRHGDKVKGALGLAALAGAAYGAYRLGGHIGWHHADKIRSVRDKGYNVMNRMGFTTPGHKGYSVVGASGPVGASGLQGSGFNAPSASGPASGYRRFGGSVGGNAAGPDKGWARLGGTIGEHYGNKRAWNRSVEPLRALVPHTTMGGSTPASHSSINAPRGSRTRASHSKINSPRLASRQ